MLSYVMDIFCTTSSFPNLGWNWKKDCPMVHIYFSDMWEDSFVPHILVTETCAPIRPSGPNGANN